MSLHASLRVTHVITSLETGGAQRMLLKLLERMDREGFESRVVSLIGGGELAPRLAELDVPVEDLGMHAGVPDPRAIFRLRRLLRTDPPHVLQSWLYHADILTALARRRTSVPALAWNLRHTFSPATTRGVAARAAPHVCARLSRVPDLVITNSQSGRESHAAIGYRARRWELVPNGFDVSAFHPDAGAATRLRAELRLGPEALVAGCVARWHPIKNVDGLLRAFGLVADELPELHLVLVGAGLEPSNRELASLLEPLGAGRRVHALGPRADVQPLVAGLDFLVLPSHHEGFPNVLGEALACDVACATTPAGDARAVVGPGGLVASGSDDASLADLIRRMVGLTPAEREALGRAGGAHVRGNYDLDAVTGRYEELYRELGAACAV